MQFVPAFYLRLPRKAWYQFAYNRIGSHSGQVILVEEGSAYSDKTHVAIEDAPELWQFIKTAHTQE